MIRGVHDNNGLLVYEVYKDEAALLAHTQAPHYLKFRGPNDGWRIEGVIQGAGKWILISGHQVISDRNRTGVRKRAYSASPRLLKARNACY